MADTNKDGLVNSDEATGVVGEEKIVNEALVNKEITDEEAGTVTSLDALEEEAKKIEMEESMGGDSVVVANVKLEDIQANIPEEKAKSEEHPQIPSASVPTEVTAEINKEPASEISKEITKEADELNSEFKKPLI